MPVSTLKRDPILPSAVETNERFGKELREGRVVEFFAEANAGNLSDADVQKLLSRHLRENFFAKMARILIG